MSTYKYEVGDIIEGTITKIVNYGAFLIFDHDVTGLLHISEITDNFVFNIGKMLKVGSTKKVKVMEVNEENGFLKVSLKKVGREEIVKFKSEGKLSNISDDEISFDALNEKLLEWEK